MAEHTSKVEGRAQRLVAPDVVAWRLTVEAKDPEPREAFERCAERATAVVDRLKPVAASRPRGSRWSRRGPDGRERSDDHEATTAAVVFADRARE